MKVLTRGFAVFTILSVIIATGCQPGRKMAGTDRFSDIPTSKTRLTNSVSYYNPDFIKMDNREYYPNIKSVKLFRQDIEFSLPVLELGTNQKLQLIFDDLDGIYREYRYTLIHCDPFWNKSNLLVAEYLDGFSEGLISSFAFSQATRQSYVHYSTLIPGPDMSITKSGNYILFVYPADHPDNILISRQFMVYESKVKVNATVKRSSVIEDQRFRHEIDFEIDRGAYQIDNPYNDLTVIIQQNGRWDNAIRDIKPKMVIGTRLSYDWEHINVFDGANEFRHFDIRSLSRYTPRIALIERDSAFHHVYIKPDFKRAFQVYIEDKDLNGEYVIVNDDALSNHDTEADYAWIHFTFPVQAPFDHGAIYISGALTNWQFLPEYRMDYNFDRNTYEVTLYLKQGYYNYHYVLLENAATVAKTFLTEGDHYETENFYTIYVYHRQPGNNYHQLIAVERIISPQPR